MNVLYKNSALGITILRVVLGIVFLLHGLQKFNGGGIDGTAGFFGGLGIPAPQIAAIVVIALEILGGIALIVGAFTRWVALLFVAEMLVALLTFHRPNGFFVANNGYEFVLTLAAGALALAFLGAGAFSVDSRLPRRFR